MARPDTAPCTTWFMLFDDFEKSAIRICEDGLTAWSVDASLVDVNAIGAHIGDVYLLVS